MELAGKEEGAVTALVPERLCGERFRFQKYPRTLSRNTWGQAVREVAGPHLPRGLWLASVPFPQWGPWAHLTEVVQDLEDREQAGPDEQPHLAPNVTCGQRISGRSAHSPLLRPPLHRPPPGPPCTHTEQFRHLIGLLLLYRLVVEGLKEDVQHQHILPGG